MTDLRIYLNLVDCVSPRLSRVLLVNSTRRISRFYSHLIFAFVCYTSELSLGHGYFSLVCVLHHHLYLFSCFVTTPFFFVLAFIFISALYSFLCTTFNFSLLPASIFFRLFFFRLRLQRSRSIIAAASRYKPYSPLLCLTFLLLSLTCVSNVFFSSFYFRLRIRRSRLIITAALYDLDSLLLFLAFLPLLPSLFLPLSSSLFILASSTFPSPLFPLSLLILPLSLDLCSLIFPIPLCSSSPSFPFSPPLPSIPAPLYSLSCTPPSLTTPTSPLLLA